MPPRLLRPKDEANSAAEANDNSGDSKSGKRRAVSSACLPCRKRKSKCDGGVPACSTCVAVYRTECFYDADSDHRRKGALKRDIQSLQQRNDCLDIIVVQLKSLPEQDAIALLHSLRTDTNPDVIAASLRNNVNLPSNHASQTLEADFAHQIGTSASASSDPSHSTAGGHNNEGFSSWFRGAPDHDFVEHLLELYFSWVHPFHQFFSKEHFLFDLRNGRRENCSAVLVNAVLAFSCHYSDRQYARTNYFNPTTAGDQFFAEAKSLLEDGERSSLTTVQALAVMSLRETSQGRDSSGYQYAGRCVRMAIELGLHLPMSTSSSQSLDAELRNVAFWSVFNLESLSSVGLGRLSQLPRSAIDVDKPKPVERIEMQPWKPYEDTLTTAATQPLQPVTFANLLSQLCEISSDMVNTFYAPRESFTSRKLAATYQQYQEWYTALPESFWFDNTSLPHVVALHMTYNFCILHLFRPYIKLDLRGANLYPRETCTQAANEISRMMGSLRAMYGLRRTSVTVTTILLSASTIHLLNLPQEAAATNLIQGMHDLQTMSVNHPYAARCLDIIRSLSVKWNIALPEDPVMRSYQIPGTLPSPATSIFYATSIPRQQSSGSRDRSLDGGPKHESPFAPPDAQMQDYDSMLATQSQMSFYSPFPSNVVPFRAMGQEQAYTNMSPSAIPAWAYAAHQQDLRRQSAPEHHEEHAQQAMWRWDQ